MGLPFPDTSWMDEPWPRERFTGWMRVMTPGRENQRADWSSAHLWDSMVESCRSERIRAAVKWKIRVHPQSGLLFCQLWRMKWTISARLSRS